MNKKGKGTPLRKRIAEIRRRIEQEPEAMVSEEEIRKFNDILQTWKEIPGQPFIERITPLRYGAVVLDLYLRLSLISELVTSVIEEAEEEVKKHKREIDEYTKFVKIFRKMLYGEKSQGCRCKMIMS